MRIVFFFETEKVGLSVTRSIMKDDFKCALVFIWIFHRNFYLMYHFAYCVYVLKKTILSFRERISVFVSILTLNRAD